MDFEKLLGFIDFRVLALLLCLMLVVAGFQKTKVFDAMVSFLLERIKSFRGICVTLVILCFFSSMLLTNDVALITFVPFGIMVLKKLKLTRYMIPVLVYETIAANLGSMLTPLGNPQNLYLYSVAEMGFMELVMLMLPYALVSLVMLLAFCMMIPGQAVEVDVDEPLHIDKWRAIAYGVLFVICILCVLHIIDYVIMLVIVLAGIVALDYRLIVKADYQLLITFIVFFVLIGYLKEIQAVNDFLSGIVKGNEVWVSVAASQVISNVPCAVLLSGFTGNTAALIIGTNLGGLGSLIASMASLISYRFYKKEEGSTGRYLGFFTVMNLIFLAVLLVLYQIVR